MTAKTAEQLLADAHARVDTGEPFHDCYKRLAAPDLVVLRACPCCGGPAELWQYSDSPTSPCTKVVMCGTSEAIGPQITDDDILGTPGCPLYMPQQGAYKATIREAVRYWNEFAVALVVLRMRRQITSGE